MCKCNNIKTVRNRLPSGISMKSVGAGASGPGPIKRPRLDHNVQHDENVDDIEEIPGRLNVPIVLWPYFHIK